MVLWWSGFVETAHCLLHTEEVTERSRGGKMPPFTYYLILYPFYQSKNDLFAGEKAQSITLKASKNLC